jgi:hypothetical protein
MRIWLSDLMAISKCLQNTDMEGSFPAIRFVARGIPINNSERRYWQALCFVISAGQQNLYNFSTIPGQRNWLDYG